MRFSQYFLYTRQRGDRSGIRMEWIESAVAHPLKTEIQRDGRIRKWIFIPETGKYLRVILLADGVTVHNAFFDRSFKG
ncbi:MAG: hypothetical protein BECKG1743D_GA0114223_107213 [Candidatus Kentron sp. G]|nr:MAG: hypothetical protein BECKG1743F_GA0114225_109643 [Candidatus Kentron sp. G]VFN05287.1 MAG: hypothetical protein BECKG1743E_GA0114224_108453 [Candidatus Kentron sp. G]VFN05454.1 MAG: hypothetical protein BECKG1743D_GA0114223_107213 [Candidatus Kentron sp. G]